MHRGMLCACDSRVRARFQLVPLILRADEASKKKSPPSSRPGPLPHQPACTSWSALGVLGKPREVLPVSATHCGLMGATPRSGAPAPELPPLSTEASAAPSAIAPRHRTPPWECGGKAFRVAGVSSPFVVGKCACLGRSKRPYCTCGNVTGRSLNGGGASGRK